jgi:hypothetical protein
MSSQGDHRGGGGRKRSRSLLCLPERMDWRVLPGRMYRVNAMWTLAGVCSVVAADGQTTAWERGYRRKKARRKKQDIGPMRERVVRTLDG